MNDRDLLSGLPLRGGGVTRLISPENPTGAKGAAAPWAPNPDDPNLKFSRAALDLGKGWKVRPFVNLTPGELLTIADIEGPGTIVHMWMTSDLKEYRALVLRIYWDGEETPSVEVPLGDFFAMGHDGAPHTVTSVPITVAPRRGLNCYWQMPFRKSARITIANEGPLEAKIFTYSIMYRLEAVPDDAAYFHAQWRRSIGRREHPEHTILDGVRGRGTYVGTYVAWSAFSRGWWGEGEVKFFLDGDVDLPTICTTGTEDYFGGAWCYYRDLEKDRREQEFSAPFLGLPLARIDDPQGPRLFSLYRWHLLDAIGFSSDVRVTIQTLGWWPDWKYEPLTDDLASTAYWYQTEPHVPYPTLPVVSARWGR